MITTTKKHSSKKKRPPQGGSLWLAACVAFATFAIGYALGFSGAELAAVLEEPLAGRIMPLSQ